ncbi:hypothetical protein EW146_g1653 [Bondarzewia mesenterica]|uniref:Uncharacterized protein n=1 Tax=Bondarzewia mesenterica TaxID=1095465 RepID=A0A4S4M9D0_9AGAM|nr:hypothetical protein EW146_g1653 [Bondarzewia mesenterica]
MTDTPDTSPQTCPPSCIPSGTSHHADPTAHRTCIICTPICWFMQFDRARSTPPTSLSPPASSIISFTSDGSTSITHMLLLLSCAPNAGIAETVVDVDGITEMAAIDIAVSSHDSTTFAFTPGIPVIGSRLNDGDALSVPGTRICICGDWPLLHVVHPVDSHVGDDPYIYSDSSAPTDHPELDENAIEDWPSLATAPEGITVAGDIENTRSLNDVEQNMNSDVRHAIPDIINTISRLRGMEPLSHEAQEDMATLDAGAKTIAASGGAVSASDLPIHTSNHASDAVSIGSRPTDALDSGVELEEDNVYPSMQVSRSCSVSQSHSFLARDVDTNNHTSINPPAPSTILLRAPAPKALYFVGIDLSSYNGRQNTVCEMGPEYSPALTLTDVLQQLMERGGLLSRTLSAVRQDMNVYGQLLLGSADIPTDVANNYMHYSCNFHEIGLWSSQKVRADSHHLEASPPSPQRTRLITQRHLPATTNVFILYCYLQDTILLRITTHPPPSTSPRECAASLNELHVMLPPTHESWSCTTAEGSEIGAAEDMALDT